jgi:alpha-tubulin suppressor-like RCC1 family protein
MKSMFKIQIILFLISFSVSANLKTFTPGLRLDPKCYDIYNPTDKTYSNCDVRLTGYFFEGIIQDGGSIFYSGNTLEATEISTATINPYLAVEVCFDFEKYTVQSPDQPPFHWVYYKSGQIIPGQNCVGTLITEGFLSLSLGTGELNGCAISPSKNLYCWGLDNDGQLGDGNNKNSSVPVPVDTSGALNGLTIKLVSSGLFHTCALASDNLLYCWGRNDVGELGNGTNVDSLVPIAVEMTGQLSGKTIKTFSVGRDHSCAIASDDKAYCWGAGTSGRLGTGNSANSSIPIPVSSTLTFKSIEVGNAHSCALALDGNAHCWGGNTNGQLGDGGNSGSFSLIPVGVIMDGALSGLTIKNLALATGSDHSCALASDNNLYCWGLNAYGQLGIGTAGGISNVPLKIQTTGVLNGLTIKSAAVGGAHTCAIASDENLYCWGDNSTGQLGTGNANSSYVPVLVGGSGTLSGRTIKMVSIGANQSCAIASDDKVYCWGKNNYGQLGNGSNTPTPNPIKVHSKPLPYL